MLIRFVRVSGTDLAGNTWSPASKSTPKVKPALLPLSAIRALFEQTGAILSLGPAEAEEAAGALMRRALAAEQTPWPLYYLRRAGLTPAEVGRIGNALLPGPGSVVT